MRGRGLDTPSTAATSREEEAIEILGRLEALLATRNARAAQAGQATLVAPATASPEAQDDHLPRFAHIPHWQDVMRAVLPFWLSIAAAAVTIIACELVARPFSVIAAVIVGVTLALLHHQTDEHHRSLVTGAFVGVAIGLGIALIS